jgi:hypothetical protein
MLDRLLLVALLFVPSIARGESVCIGRDGTAGTLDGIGEIAKLHRRGCFAVEARETGRTKVVVSTDGVVVPLWVADTALLYELAESVDLTGRDGSAWGRILSGAPVIIEDLDGDTAIVRVTEGRLQPRFRVERGQLLPAARWPKPDPDDGPDRPFPEALFPAPPQGTSLRAPDGGEVIASVLPPPFDRDDVLLDWTQGRLRFQPLEDHGEYARIRVVAPTMWVEGLSYTREYLTEPGEDWQGWDPQEGWKAPATFTPPLREAVDKDAPLYGVAKGERIGTLRGLARFDVVEEDGNWVKITHRWPEGALTGWVDKRRVTKEGKELGKPITPARPSALVLTLPPKVAWLNPGPEPAPDAEPNAKPDPLRHLTDPEFDALPMQLLVREHAGALRIAYARDLRKDPTASGMAVAKLVVDETGQIESVEMTEVTVPKGEALQALADLLATVVFPERKLKKSKKDPKDYRLAVELRVIFVTAPRQ